MKLLNNWRMETEDWSHSIRGPALSIVINVRFRSSLEMVQRIPLMSSSSITAAAVDGLELGDSSTKRRRRRRTNEWVRY
jgi:hypothetical protein